MDPDFPDEEEMKFEEEEEFSEEEPEFEEEEEEPGFEEEEEEEEEGFGEEEEEELPEEEITEEKVPEEKVPEEEVVEEEAEAVAGVKAVPEEEKKAPVKPEEISVNVIIEVGQLKMNVQKLIELQPGNLLELGIHPEKGVDLTVNGRRVAKGELLRIGDTLGVRILELG